MPFKIVYGRDPPSLIPYSFPTVVPADVHEHLKNRDEVLQLLKGNLLKAQQRMKKYADLQH